MVLCVWSVWFFVLSFLAVSTLLLRPCYALSTYARGCPLEPRLDGRPGAQRARVTEIRGFEALRTLRGFEGQWFLGPIAHRRFITRKYGLGEVPCNPKRSDNLKRSWEREEISMVYLEKRI